MKLAGWMAVGLVLLAILVAMSPLLKGRNHAMAKANISAITGRHGIELVQAKQWCGSRPVGGPLENGLRTLCRLDHREEGFQLVEYHLRDPSGDFSVQIWESDGRVYDVVIYKPATGLSGETEAALRELLPDARYQ